MSQNYKVLTNSILANKANWDKDMRYLIPALSNFLIAMIYKYPEHFTSDPNNIQQLQAIVSQLMNTEVRMESTAMSIAGAIFEKLAQGGGATDQFVQGFLYSVFTCLHFYRNNTKTQMIPMAISKSIWSCFSIFIIYHGTQALI